MNWEGKVLALVELEGVFRYGGCFCEDLGGVWGV